LLLYCFFTRDFWGKNKAKNIFSYHCFLLTRKTLVILIYSQILAHHRSSKDYLSGQISSIQPNPLCCLITAIVIVLKINVSLLIFVSSIVHSLFSLKRKTSISLLCRYERSIIYPEIATGDCIFPRI